MSTNYIYGVVLTGQGVAANNRGENENNVTTLQKVIFNDEEHTTVSAEALRFAIREHFSLEGLSVNRCYDKESARIAYEDPSFSKWNNGDFSSVDDDIMGFMNAKASKTEKEDDLDSITEAAVSDDTAIATAAPAKKKKLQKKSGTCDKRQSPLAMGRAISLRPWRGEQSFNCVSGDKTKGGLSLYGAEMHTTEFQYSFGLNLNDVKSKQNITHTINAIMDIPQVAGNHSRFLYDFSPETIIFYITNAHSPKILNCFEIDDSNSITAEKLIWRIMSGDIKASEIIIGGLLTQSNAIADLKNMGVFVCNGVLAAKKELLRRVANLGPEYAICAPKDEK